MIGKAYKAMTPYYDKVAKKQAFKARPCVVIGKADADDYVILPISRVKSSAKIDPYYDIPLDKTVFTFLTNDSYLRTHKQTVANVATLRGPIADFMADYEDTYLDAISKVEEFQDNLIKKAI